MMIRVKVREEAVMRDIFRMDESDDEESKGVIRVKAFGRRLANQASKYFTFPFIFTLFVFCRQI